MFHKKLYTIFVLLFWVGFSVFGQSRKQLESDRKKLKVEIEKVNRLLFDVKKREVNALEDLRDLNQKIKIRTRLIETIARETKVLTSEIKSNEKKRKVLEKTLSDLKADYASMIYKSYKSKSQQSKVMFLLSSQNFYQAYKRLEYMKQYASFRKGQAEEIAIQSAAVQKLNDSLVSQKKIKNTLIFSEKGEKKKIEVDKKKKERLIATIKNKERKYKRSLRKKINQEKRIASKIDEIIRNAIATSNKRIGKKAKTKNEFALSPEAKALATKFELNKGRLPWPVTEGLVVREFGVQPHPTLKGIVVNSTGLHIITRKGMLARCIFGGQVLAIQLTAEGRKNVLVQHGNYITAYNNLEKSFVKTGDKISTGEEVGKIFTDKVTGKTTLIFVLFKNTKRLNPSSWILKKK